MQWKQAPRSRLAARYHEWAMRRGFPVLVRIAPKLPRWFLFLGARIIIWSVMLVYPKPKRAIDRNLVRILGPSARAGTVRRLRRRMIYNLAYYWVDLFRFCQLPFEQVRALIGDVTGMEHLEAAVERGQGVMLLTAHLGNWELGGFLLKGLDLPVSVVYVRDQSPSAEQFRAFLRGLIDVGEIPIDPSSQLSSIPILHALSEGRLVAMQGDRDFNDQDIRFDFFGKPAPFPVGPAILARLTGAALIPAFITYGERHQLDITFGAPIEVAADGARQAAAVAATRRWVEVVETAVRRWPDQWYTFYDFWNPPQEGRRGPSPGSGPPATSEDTVEGTAEGTGDSEPATASNRRKARRGGRRRADNAGRAAL
jgi:KDO2-lipid IV(A) lauroyltransferase